VNKNYAESDVEQVASLYFVFRRRTQIFLLTYLLTYLRVQANSALCSQRDAK